MSESNNQRIYLACGTVFLTIFSFAAVIATIMFSPGDQLAVAGTIGLAVSIAVLLFNTTLLFASRGGPGILTIAKALLWLSFLLIVAVLGLYITIMAGSL